MGAAGLAQVGVQKPEQCCGRQRGASPAEVTRQVAVHRPGQSHAKTGDQERCQGWNHTTGAQGPGSHSRHLQRDPTGQLPGDQQGQQPERRGVGDRMEPWLAVTAAVQDQVPGCQGQGPAEPAPLERRMADRLQLLQQRKKAQDRKQPQRRPLQQLPVEPLLQLVAGQAGGGHESQGRAKYNVAMGIFSHFTQASSKPPQHAPCEQQRFDVALMGSETGFIAVQQPGAQESRDAHQQAADEGTVQHRPTAALQAAIAQEDHARSDQQKITKGAGQTPLLA